VSVASRFEKMKPGFDLSQAMAEADRCLLCHDAPCSKACPSDTDPGAFIRKLRLKNITGAIRTIKENNILGGACGILCPTERLCEQECSAIFKTNVNPVGGETAIRIGAIQRFLIEHSWQRGIKVLEQGEPKPGKVAIIGSGPAGLSCAAELAQAGYQATIFESRPEPGGVLRYGVVPFRFEKAFFEKEMEDIKSLGVEIKCNSRIDGKNGAEKLLEEGYSAVFLAPGLWDAVQLKSAAPEINGLYSSVDYLSALRDGRFDELAAKIRGKTVAVIGGGAVAMDCIGSAIRLDPKDVYLVYRRSFMQMPAEEDERIESLEAGIHFLLLNQPIDYEVNGDNQLTGLKLVRTCLGEPDDSGRRRPVEIAGSEWILDADIVIEAIGNQAEAESDQWYSNVAVDEKKLIKANPDTGETSVKGVFAGGDIVRGPSLVVNAVQDGKLAARAIQDFLT
jgi:glutamate synthase (NADPH) small chain